MIILLLLGVALSGVTVAFVARAVAVGAVRREETLAQIESYGFSGREIQQADPSRPRGPRATLDSVATSLGKLTLRRLGASRTDDLRKLLLTAGLYRTDVEKFIGYRVGATLVLPALLLFLSSSSGGLSLRTFLGIVMASVLGWILPTMFLKRRGEQRVQEIDGEVPELVDLLVTTVEAGVGFAAALQLVARQVEGPLGQELRITLREQAMGLTIENALDNMRSRIDSISVRVFVQAIVQGQLLGVSIGKILRDLAVDMRKRRRQLAEERAQKMPTKILFPLIFLILPALFIIVLGGPILGIAKTFGSIG
jgi:tight adherence protein C